jgi:ionotropic glutamate receptor
VLNVWFYDEHMQVVTVLKAAIKDDYKKTRQCKITITAVDASSRAGGWGLAKKSPYLENFNRG